MVVVEMLWAGMIFNVALLHCMCMASDTIELEDAYVYYSRSNEDEMNSWALASDYQGHRGLSF